jgi:hypothetical protein
LANNFAGLELYLVELGHAWVKSVLKFYHPSGVAALLMFLITAEHIRLCSICIHDGFNIVPDKKPIVMLQLAFLPVIGKTCVQVSVLLGFLGRWQVRALFSKFILNIMAFLHHCDIIPAFATVSLCK